MEIFLLQKFFLVNRTCRLVRDLTQIRFLVSKETAFAFALPLVEIWLHEFVNKFIHKFM